MDKLINEFSFGLFFWQLLIFIGLVLLLKKFAWKPILDSVNERENSIKEALSSADRARKEIESLNEKNKKILVEAREEREDLIKEAKATSTKIIDNAKKEAEVIAEKLISQAQESINSEKKIAIEELKVQVADFSIKMAEKILRSELKDKDKQRKLIDDLIKDSKL
ncbi:MAG: ATP synthase F0 subunit B [Flavobacteriaceae bacterium]|nr:ATP synthase F0 subunit B [Flavobacteriaceae bacterium]|tara:strand:+ start:1341 stop:1838 length:498 start_codon:yes stop_codon:yes gene_type:complete